jgi:hypothetical protein
LQQKVNTLQSREKFFLQSTAKMQQKLEHFDLVFFDEDMELPEPKKCKKKRFDTQEDKKQINIFDT